MRPAPRLPPGGTAALMAAPTASAAEIWLSKRGSGGVVPRQGRQQKKETGSGSGVPRRGRRQKRAAAARALLAWHWRAEAGRSSVHAAAQARGAASEGRTAWWAKGGQALGRVARQGGGRRGSIARGRRNSRGGEHMPAKFILFILFHNRLLKLLS